MGRKYSRRAVLAGGAAGLATLSGCGLLDPQRQVQETPPGAGSATGTVKLGVLAPQSGLLERYGKDIVDAANLAKRQVIASRNGFGVEMAVKDTESNPTTAVSGARELHEEGYAAIIGPGSMESVLKVMNQVLKPESIAANTPLAMKGPGVLDDNSLVWGTGPTVNHNADALARAIALEAIDTAAIIYTKNHYGEQLNEVLARKIGDRRVDVGKQVGIEPGADSYSGKVEEVMADDPSGVVVATGPSGIQVLRDFYSSYSDTPTFLPDRLKRAEIPSELDVSLENTTVTSMRPIWHREKLPEDTAEPTDTDSTATPTAAGEDSDLLTNFVEAFQIAYDRFPSVHAAQAFDATVTFMMAIVRTETDPTSERYNGANIQNNVIQVTNNQEAISDVRGFGPDDYWEGFGSISQGIYNTYGGISSGVEYGDQSGWITSPPMHAAKFAPDTKFGFEETLPIPL